MKKSFVFFTEIAALICLAQFSCQAWDYEGHRFVNQLALVSMPDEFPAFLKTPEVRERIAFLAGEPDRWRNTPDLTHYNGPDHYIDLEQLADYGLDANHLSHFRYDFAAQLARARAEHPDKFPPIDPEQDRDHTRALVGFLPWAINENFDKLKSEFSYLKAFEKAGTPEEISNAQQNIIYTMGVMGHYVGDGSQPLHTTIHHHGWVGNNPNNFTTRHNFHGEIDGYFRNLDTNGFNALAARIHPAKMPGDELGMTSNDIFDATMVYLLNNNKLVTPLYQLEKDGKLIGPADKTVEGHEMLGKQLVVAGQMLGDIWYAAWKESKEDTYLEGQLQRRSHPHPDGN